MCGICGVIDFSNSVNQHSIEMMVKTLSHRGPDDWGVASPTPLVSLGHSRLSIIDLTSAAHQPMYNDDKQICITYNGEIYNFHEIRHQLAAQGVKFNSHSDTEVVVKAYELWGEAAFHRFNGMFAFAIWDQRKNALLLVRDRFGIKPLYYWKSNNQLIFASEIKAILNYKSTKTINMHAAHEYFWFGNSLGANTLFENIYKLLPGHQLTFFQGNVQLKPYAALTPLPIEKPSRHEAIDKVGYLLEQSVKRHLISDVPVGIFLSGGLDSSAITALASRLSERKLQTFCVGFDFADKVNVNELPKAKLIADYFSTDHHELHITASQIPQTLQSLVSCHDEPFADAANIPLYLLSQSLNGSIKVVLQGDGGDEIFAGYRRYQLLRYFYFWRLLVSCGFKMQKLIANPITRNRINRLNLALSANENAVRMALLLTRDSALALPTNILSNAFKEQLLKTDPFQAYQHYDAIYQKAGLAQRSLFTDCNIQLPSTFLEKVDKATMAHGLEVRVPMLDNALVRYIMSLPINYKIRRGKPKWLLQQVMRDKLPKAILNYPKTGFNVPYDFWLKKSLLAYFKAVVFDDVMVRSQIFSIDTLRRYLVEHTSGQCNHGFILWKALNFALWYQTYMKGD